MALKILCVIMNSAGHLNGVLGLAYILKDKGHQVIFASERSCSRKLEELGFEEVLFDGDAGGEVGNPLNKNFPLNFRQDLFDRATKTEALRFMVERVKRENGPIAQILKTVKPDIIINDHLMTHPCLVTSNIPLVMFKSGNPLEALTGPDLPPARFGLPVSKPTEQWSKLRQAFHQGLKPLWEDFNEYCMRQGAPSLEEGKLYYTSSNLNLFMYPNSLASEYLERCPFGSLWTVIDHAIRPVTSSFTLPQSLLDLPGKLIYVSMGTVGCRDVELMKILVKKLSKAEHKFIVSKGALGDQFELPENMWGDAYLPQLNILPTVDLVIGHGGNNSFIETLYFGKPMIVIPLFGDQPDNAQRAVDAKLGARFNLVTQSEEELVNLIEYVLGNEEINKNVKLISNELKESKSMEYAAEKLEQVMNNPCIPTVRESFIYCQK